MIMSSLVDAKTPQKPELPKPSFVQTPELPSRPWTRGEEILQDHKRLADSVFQSLYFDCMLSRDDDSMLLGHDRMMAILQGNEDPSQKRTWLALSIRLAELWFRHSEIREDGTYDIDEDTLRGMVGKLASFMNRQSPNKWEGLIHCVLERKFLTPEVCDGLMLFGAHQSNCVDGNNQETRLLLPTTLGHPVVVDSRLRDVVTSPKKMAAQSPNNTPRRLNLKHVNAKGAVTEIVADRLEDAAKLLDITINNKAILEDAKTKLQLGKEREITARHTETEKTKRKKVSAYTSNLELRLKFQKTEADRSPEGQPKQPMFQPSSGTHPTEIEGQANQAQRSPARPVSTNHRRGTGVRGVPDWSNTDDEVVLKEHPNQPYMVGSDNWDYYGELDGTRMSLDCFREKPNPISRERAARILKVMFAVHKCERFECRDGKANVAETRGYWTRTYTCSCATKAQVKIQRHFNTHPALPGTVHVWVNGQNNFTKGH
jgi:hypothetical protein